MIRNYLIIAWRNFRRNKVFSLINVLGLAIAFTFSLFIIFLVWDEASYDQFHENGKRIYCVLQTQTYEDGTVSGSDATSAQLPGALKEEMVEVERATMMSTYLMTIKVGDKVQREMGSFVSEDFFQLFSFPLVQGNPKNCISAVDQIVISQKLATNYFGTHNPIGKPIRIDNGREFFVSGVFADIPKNSSIQIDFALPFKEHEKAPWAKDWGAIGEQTFILLKENTDPNDFNKKIKHYLKSKITATKDQLILQPFTEKYLYSNFKNGVIDGGRIEYVRILSVIAGLILLIACINFMNLSTAQSMKRAKEVGIRKVIGSSRKLLIGQFMGEALFTVVAALIISLGLVQLALPFFNSLTERELQLDFTQSGFLVSIAAIALTVGFLSGSYPALFLSALKPVIILKGAFKFNSSTTMFRKVLVVLQFSLSIAFIAATIIVYQQMQFIQNKNLGLDRENVIYQTFEGNLKQKLDVFKTELLQSPGIQAVTYSNQPLLNIQYTSNWVDWPGKTKEVNFATAGVSYDFIKTLKIQLLAGRDFSSENTSDSSNVIINEEAAKRMGLIDPIGHEISTRRDMLRKGKIIGIMKDFHLQSLHKPIEPLFIWFDTYPTSGYITVRTEAGKTKAALASMDKLNKKYNPDFPFNYTFTEEDFKKQYKIESQFENLIQAFSFFTVFISCLGLFGLAVFSAEQRTKEIGVRKVMGASVLQVICYQ